MWIEAITVRTARPGQCVQLLEDMAAFREQGAIAGPLWFVCYRNLEVENEICVHLAWKAEFQAMARTDCGLLIARRFARHGLVHHTLWKQTAYTCFK